MYRFGLIHSLNGFVKIRVCLDSGRFRSGFGGSAPRLFLLDPLGLFASAALGIRLAAQIQGKLLLNLFLRLAERLRDFLEKAVNMPAALKIRLFLCNSLSIAGLRGSL